MKTYSRLDAAKVKSVKISYNGYYHCYRMINPNSGEIFYDADTEEELVNIAREAHVDYSLHD